MSVEEDARTLLNEMRAQHEAREIENAEAFAIVVTCVESGSVMTWVHGPISSYVEALRLAEVHETELNSGNAEGDDPFVAKVYPMSKPEWD